jgi:hypothetical protein
VPKQTKIKQKPQPGPDDVVRQEAGSYLSGDGRFEVRQSDTNWYLVDLEQANEFGQELMHGPFGSLKDAKAALPGARDVKPLLKSTKRTPTVAKKPKSQPPKSWIDELPDAERRDAQALIKALEREGLPNAEELAKRHRNDDAAVAARLIEHRLSQVIDEAPAESREQTKTAVKRVLEILTVEGGIVSRPLPRWQLSEVDPPDQSAAKRRVAPKI